MKFGFRKPSLKRIISARISIKRQIVHRAGLKMPWLWISEESQESGLQQSI